VDAAWPPRFRDTIGNIPLRLTVTLQAAGSGTRATVTYRVSGDAGHGLEALAPVVDTVIRQQFGGFARPATVGPPSS
jgi:hypothetical protein